MTRTATLPLARITWDPGIGALEEDRRAAAALGRLLPEFLADARINVARHTTAFKLRMTSYALRLAESATDLVEFADALTGAFAMGVEGDDHDGLCAALIKRVACAHLPTDPTHHRELNMTVRKRTCIEGQHANESPPSSPTRLCAAILLIALNLKHSLFAPPTPPSKQGVDATVQDVRMDARRTPEESAAMTAILASEDHSGKSWMNPIFNQSISEAAVSLRQHLTTWMGPRLKALVNMRFWLVAARRAVVQLEEPAVTPLFMRCIRDFRVKGLAAVRDRSLTKLRAASASIEEADLRREFQRVVVSIREIVWGRPVPGREGWEGADWRERSANGHFSEWAAAAPGRALAVIIARNATCKDCGESRIV